jgi:hypothetical protein
LNSTKSQLEEIRAELISLTQDLGPLNEKTIKKSQELDQIILKEMKQSLGKRTGVRESGFYSK